MPMPENDLSNVVTALNKIADALNRLAAIAERTETRASGGPAFPGAQSHG